MIDLVYWLELIIFLSFKKEAFNSFAIDNEDATFLITNLYYSFQY